MFICLIVALVFVTASAVHQVHMQSLRSFKQPDDLARLLNPRFKSVAPLGSSLPSSSKHSVDAITMGKPKKLTTAAETVEARQLGSWTDKLHQTDKVATQTGTAPVITGVAVGWAYSNFYASCNATDTSSAPSVVGGSVIGLCTPSQAIDGPSAGQYVYFDSCNSTSITKYVYSEAGCQTESFLFSESISLNLCQIDASRNLGYKFQCTTASTALPMKESEYITIETSFNSNSLTQCQAVADQFTAYQWYTCIKGNKQGPGGFGSYRFGCSNPATSDPATVTARTYNDANCGSFNHPTTLPVGCSTAHSGSLTEYQNISCLVFGGTEYAFDDTIDFDDGETNSTDDNVFANGYLVYEYFNGYTCADSNSFTVGYALNTCLVGYDEYGSPIGSIQGTCDATAQEFRYKQFQSIDCTGSHTNANYTAEVPNCFATKEGNPWGESASIRCAFGEGIPVNFESVVVTGYAGNGANTCNNTPTMVLAYGVNNAETCFPVGSATGFAQSYQLQCFTDQTSFSVLEYAQSGTCDSSYKTASYPSGCFSAQSQEYQDIESFLNLDYWSSKLFQPSSNAAINSELDTSADTARELSQTTATTAYTYLVENFHVDFDSCNNTDPTQNFVTASQGYAVGVCINQYDGAVIIGSAKYMCSVGLQAQNIAEYFEWDTANCKGTPSNSANLTLNSCRISSEPNSSYAVNSFTCPVTPNFDDGYVYQLKYEISSDPCNSLPPIEYSAVQSTTCVSEDSQTSQIYSCYSDTEIQVATFSDANCAKSTGVYYYQETCNTSTSIQGYYTEYYCSSGANFNSYFIKYYYDQDSNCSANSEGLPPTALASQGYIINTCIVNYDNDGPATSFKYTCSGSGSATQFKYNTTDCSGVSTTIPYTLDTCQTSVGTSYGAYSYSCNSNPVPLDNGQIYNLKYDSTSNLCQGGDPPFIEFSSVEPDLCVSTNSQTGSKYYCDGGQSVTVESYSTAGCTSDNPTAKIFPATCNPTVIKSNVITGYNMPYCSGGDDYRPFVPGYPSNQTTLYEYVSVSCQSAATSDDDDDSTSNSSSDSSSKEATLSVGAISGIVIAAVVVAIGVGYFCRKRSKTSDLNETLITDKENSGHSITNTNMFSSSENPITRQNNESFDKNNKF